MFDSQPTAFDLNFRLFGTDVRVHPSFWVVSLLLGWGEMNRPGGGFGYLLMWVACVFFCVLLHEFGHITAGKIFGSQGHILLQSMGGLAIGINLYRRWQRVLMIFAGPGIQFLLLGVLLLAGPSVLQQVPKQYDEPAKELFIMLVEINLFWPILNLLPIWPLDGGQITRELFEAVVGPRGIGYSLIVSMIFSGVMAVHCLLVANNRAPLIRLPYIEHMGSMYMGLFFAFFAMTSFQAYQIEGQRRRPDIDDRLPWE